MNCISERRRQIHICILKERVWEIRQIGGKEWKVFPCLIIIISFLYF